MVDDLVSACVIERRPSDIYPEVRIYYLGTVRTFLTLAVLSLLASVCLALAPIVAPQTIVGPIIIVNWFFFISTQLKHTRRAKVADLSFAQSRTWDRLQIATLLSFTGAGLFALGMGSPIL